MLVLPNARTAISERYTSPLKLFEYLAMGRPIVASDLPSIREVLTDSRTALLVPPGDPQALAGALSRLAGDRALARALGRASLALAADFTWIVGPSDSRRRSPRRRRMISARLFEVARCPNAPRR
jgi:glycosyltransferase involved in cell wall biosynthesis